jgi:amino acid transporter
MFAGSSSSLKSSVQSTGLMHGSKTQSPHLHRQLGLPSAVALNMLDMIGVGPFMTLSLVVSALGGSRALLAWILGALIAACDGLVWAELGAIMPQAGGSYAFLREIYGPDRWGRLVSFLFVWQLSFSAPLSIASGCIGLAQYAAWLFPVLDTPVAPAFPWLHWSSLVAAGSCLTVLLLLYRNLSAIARLAWLLFAGVLLTLALVIFAGVTHFHAKLAFSHSLYSFQWNGTFLQGLGAATLIATYDYWGYYNVCFLGAEIRNPGRNIPRAVLLSIALVALLYLTMNISVLGILPTSEIVSGNRYAVVATAVAHSLGSSVARVVAALVMWSAFASIFSLLLGYSRVPYAAAKDGNYFRALASLHPRHGFPHRSLLSLGLVATVFCFFPLPQVIAALVVVRVVMQFLLQHVGVILLRWREPERPRPFRLWFYPLPPLAAFAGFVFILVSRHAAGRELLVAAVIAVSGGVVFLVRARLEQAWPFAEAK